MPNFDEKVTALKGQGFDVDTSGELDIAPLKIRILRFETDDDGGNYAGMAYFHSEGATLADAPTVCLSRNKPGSCNYPIDGLQGHDYHAPAFTVKEELDSYIFRIKADIQEAINAFTGEIIPVSEVENLDELID